MARQRIILVTNIPGFIKMEKKKNLDWRQHEEFIRKNINRMDLAEMAEVLNVSEYDLYQFVHRERIFPISTKPKNLAYELVKIKFVHPEYFKPTRRFYRAVGMTQRQWWSAFRGEIRLTEEQYKRLSIHLGITLEEAFEARQLELITIEE